MSDHTNDMAGFQIQGTVTSETPWLEGGQWNFEIEAHTHRSRLPQRWTVRLVGQETPPRLHQGETYLVFGWLEGNRNSGHAELLAESTGDIHPIRSE